MKNIGAVASGAQGLVLAVQSGVTTGGAWETSCRNRD